MTKAFADTAYFLALVSSRDVAHRAANDYSKNPAQVIVTTTAVLLELGGHLSKGQDRQLLVNLVRTLKRNPAFELIQVDDALLSQGPALFEERADKNWSLTDCISFLVMRDRNIDDALTTDQHFSQAGFNVVIAV